MSDRDFLKKQQEGALNALSPTFVTDAHKAVADAHTRAVPVVLAAIVKGDDTVEAPILELHRACIFRGAHLVPNGALTGDATDFITVTVYQRLPDGSDADPLATFATNATPSHDLAQFKPVDLVLSGAAADLQLPVDTILTYDVLHSGAGAALAAGAVLILELEEV